MNGVGVALVKRSWIGLNKFSNVVPRRTTRLRMTHEPVKEKDPQIAVHYKAIQSKLTKVLPQNFSLAIKWHFCFREAKVDGIPNWNREIFCQKGRILS